MRADNLMFHVGKMCSFYKPDEIIYIYILNKMKLGDPKNPSCVTTTWSILFSFLYWQLWLSSVYRVNAVLDMIARSSMNTY